ncbi:MAG: hypothetical protein ACRCTI_11445, partial [Beijerinckiaceae bacterium]
YEKIDSIDKKLTIIARNQSAIVVYVGGMPGRDNECSDQNCASKSAERCREFNYTAGQPTRVAFRPNPIPGLPGAPAISTRSILEEVVCYDVIPRN